MFRNKCKLFLKSNEKNVSATNFAGARKRGNIQGDNVSATMFLCFRGPRTVCHNCSNSMHPVTRLKPHQEGLGGVN